MSAPETLREMKRAGYERLGNGTCRHCDAQIAWMKTSLGRIIPLNLPIADSNVPTVAHWRTCPNSKLVVDRTRHRSRLVQACLESTGAKAMVAVYPEESVFALTGNLDGEEIRHDLITVADKVRSEIQSTSKGDA